LIKYKYTVLAHKETSTANYMFMFSSRLNTTREHAGLQTKKSMFAVV